MDHGPMTDSNTAPEAQQINATTWATGNPQPGA
jgi:hypothetical protein